MNMCEWLKVYLIMQTFMHGILVLVYLFIRFIAPLIDKIKC